MLHNNYKHNVKMKKPGFELKYVLFDILLLWKISSQKHGLVNAVGSNCQTMDMSWTVNTSHFSVWLTFRVTWVTSWVGVSSLATWEARC